MDLYEEDRVYKHFTLNMITPKALKPETMCFYSHPDHRLLLL